MIFESFIAIIALIVAIVAIAQISILRARLEDLETRLRPAERAKDGPPPATAVPPPLPKSVQTPPPRPVAAPPATAPLPDRGPGINWESFVGVRLFAWIGGFALFLGVVFFVKYAFDNNLVTPRMRIFSGGLVGLTLIGLGIAPTLRRYWIPAQSLIATGILICYADIYAAHSFYGLISLTVASVLMWLVTALALGLGARVGAPAILWLGVIGGFLTPLLFRTNYQSTIALFGYVGILICGIATVSAVKRWNYFIVAAAVCTVIIEFIWAAGFFGRSDAESGRRIFFLFQALFLVLSIALVRTGRGDNWSFAAAAVAGLAPLLAFVVDPLSSFQALDFGFLTPLLAVTGLLLLIAAHGERFGARKNAGAALIVLALLLTCLGEWRWWYSILGSSSGVNDFPLTVVGRMGVIGAWHAAIFLVFAAAPYVCGDKPSWPWIVAATAGPSQFWFVHSYLTVPAGLYRGRPVLPHQWAWLLPVAFALPAAVGIWYLVRRRGVDLSSGDSRLASQGAAFLTFVSLIFPVQFHREWITLGWALEGLGLILLFRIVPNRRLRGVALIVFFAAFVRLAFNPAVLEYHPRSHTPILNWYLYAYGLAGLCLFAGAYWFGEPREHGYERQGPPLLYALSGIILFLLLNIEIADYFSIGPTLTFSFAGNFARDMTYTISWAVFAFGMLLVGMFKQIRPVRLAATALLCVALGKLFLHDLDNLSQLYRIAAFVSVAIIAMVASFVYQRFLANTD